MLSCSYYAESCFPFSLSKAIAKPSCGCANGLRVRGPESAWESGAGPMAKPTCNFYYGCGSISTHCRDTEQQEVALEQIQRGEEEAISLRYFPGEMQGLGICPPHHPPPLGLPFLLWRVHVGPHLKQTWKPRGSP